MEQSSFIHEIIIQKLKIKNQLEGTELTDIVISCDWEWSTWHVNNPSVRHTITSSTEFTLSPGDIENFIPFEQLDEQTVLGWIEQYTPNFNELKLEQESQPSIQFDEVTYTYVEYPFSSEELSI